eukprot:scaffold3667_cov180-Amphora_coffeaeformis.AAC.3
MLKSCIFKVILQHHVRHSCRAYQKLMVCESWKWGITIITGIYHCENGVKSSDDVIKWDLGVVREEILQRLHTTTIIPVDTLWVPVLVPRPCAGLVFSEATSVYGTIFKPELASCHWTTKFSAWRKLDATF